MAKKAYQYFYISCSGTPPADWTQSDLHSEVLTLYDTDEERLEKVAVIHNPQHFGGSVDGLHDRYPYDAKNCPCQGEKAPVRVWNGHEIVMFPYADWVEDPEVAVLYLDP